MNETLTRLLMRIEVDPATDCWLWTGARTAGGYAEAKVAGKVTYVHRFVYEAKVGPIPDGHHIDHLCRVRHCVNPAHLEAVEPVENWERGQSPTRLNREKTHCVHGHSLADAYVEARGRRQCRICKVERARAARRKGEAA